MKLVTDKLIPFSWQDENGSLRSNFPLDSKALNVKTNTLCLLSKKQGLQSDNSSPQVLGRNTVKSLVAVIADMAICHNCLNELVATLITEDGMVPEENKTGSDITAAVSKDNDETNNAQVS